MANPGIIKHPKDTVLAAIKRAAESNAGVASREFNLPHATLGRWVRIYRDGGYLECEDGTLHVKSHLVTEAPPDPNEPIDELLDRKEAHYKRAKAFDQFQKWREIRPTISGPIGIALMGDPHIDDDGCNIPLLREHVEILRETEGLYCINLGDTTNNWVGKLARLWANQKTTPADALRLSKWLMADSGIDWMAVIYGNHDLWTGEPGQGNPLDYIIASKTEAHLWEAQLKIVFDNGLEFKIHAAHSFPGHSMWNRIHGMTRAQKFGPGDVSVYAQGHHHEWDIHTGEDEDTGQRFHLIKARGYKDLNADTYHKRGFYRSQRYGACPVVVIDPTNAKGIVSHAFDDLAQGAEWLAYLRR